jgi:glycerate 2-kinase
MADLKRIAAAIFSDTLRAIDIAATMQRKLCLEQSRLIVGTVAYDLRRYERVRAVAMGKAAHAMLVGLRQVLGPEVELRGVVAAPSPPASRLSGFHYFLAGHPVPNAASFEAARTILDALRRWDDERTLVFFLVSGGGSALVELPLDPQQTIGDAQQLYAALVSCGASIDEINTIRKHVSAVKGGRLVLAAPNATKITLAVSDVPAGQESALASGPTLPDPTTIAEFHEIVSRYQLQLHFPETLRRWLVEGALRESPKGSEPAFANAHFCVLLGTDDLFHPAHRAAESKGFLTCCDNTTDDWSLARAADFLLRQLAELKASNPQRRVAVIADGEVSSPVRGKGIGGRNSAFVLACVERIAGKRIAVLSAGTDGIDGNSPAAGAVADGGTQVRAQAVGLEVSVAEENSDAFSFFERLGDDIVTGPTGNNLRDLRILLAD